MSYTTDDFTESLSRAHIALHDVARVVSAWGKGDGQGDDAGHYRWAEDGVTDWRGGFLLQMKAGGYTYVTGWCDYTGWGCQDGVDIYCFATLPSVDQMRFENEGYGPDASEWDVEPADLNRRLTGAEV